MHPHTKYTCIDRHQNSTCKIFYHQFIHTHPPHTHKHTTSYTYRNIHNTITFPSHTYPHHHSKKKKNLERKKKTNTTTTITKNKNTHSLLMDSRLLRRSSSIVTPLAASHAFRSCSNLSLSSSSSVRSASSFFRIDSLRF